MTKLPPEHNNLIWAAYETNGCNLSATAKALEPTYGPITAPTVRSYILKHCVQQLSPDELSANRELMVNRYENLIAKVQASEDDLEPIEEMLDQSQSLLQAMEGPMRAVVAQAARLFNENPESPTAAAYLQDAASKVADLAGSISRTATAASKIVESRVKFTDAEARHLNGIRQVMGMDAPAKMEVSITQQPDFRALVIDVIENDDVEQLS